MQNLFLRPARDATGAPMLVRDPFGWKPLAKDGEWKPATQYWLNRLRDGDVIEGEEKPEAIAPAPEIEPEIEPAPPASA